MEREEFKILVKAMKAVYAQPTFIQIKTLSMCGMDYYKIFRMSRQTWQYKST